MPVLWKEAFRLTLGEGLSDPASEEEDVLVWAEPRDSTDQVELISRERGREVFMRTRLSRVLTR